MAQQRDHHEVEQRGSRLGPARQPLPRHEHGGGENEDGAPDGGQQLGLVHLRGRQRNREQGERHGSSEWSSAAEKAPSGEGLNVRVHYSDHNRDTVAYTTPADAIRAKCGGATLAPTSRCLAGSFFARQRNMPYLRGTMARGDVRIAVTLACDECKRRNYQTEKSKRNDPEPDRDAQVLPLVRQAHGPPGDPMTAGWGLVPAARP